MKETLKKIPVGIAVVFGVFYLFTLGTQTPAQGRGPADDDSQCRAIPACVMENEKLSGDPAGVFNSIDRDSLGTDSVVVSNVLIP